MSQKQDSLVSKLKEKRSEKEKQKNLTKRKVVASKNLDNISKQDHKYRSKPTKELTLSQVLKNQESKKESFKRKSRGRSKSKVIELS